MMEVCTHVALTAVDSLAKTNQGCPQVNFKCEQNIDFCLFFHYKLWVFSPPCSTMFVFMCMELYQIDVKMLVNSATTIDYPLS